MIPKVIHYCWFGGNPLPAYVKKYIKSWEKHCPDYKIICWDESNFDVNSHPFMKAAYEAKAWAFVSDYARLKIVYENGGIYLDTDVELLKNLDFLLENKFYIGVQQVGRYVTTGLGFGAEQYNETVKELLEQYENIEFSEENKRKIACPILNMKVFDKYGYIYENSIWNQYGITIYPCSYFDPVSPGMAENLLCEETVSMHHYSSSWETKGIVIKRKLINMIGQQNINMIKKKIKVLFK